MAAPDELSDMLPGADAPVDVQYQLLDEITNGLYGTISKGRDLRTGGLVTIKCVELLPNRSGIPSSALHEIAVLKTLGQQSHPNIIRLLDVVNGPRTDDILTTIFLVFEHMEKKLDSYIALCPSPGIPIEIIKSLMKQILSGIDFLHCNRVVHRDIKPQNIFMSNDFKIKIAEFTLSKMYQYDEDRMLNSVITTLCYGAPELILNVSYSFTADMWSCGCIMAELYKLFPFFFGRCKVEQLNNVFRVIGLPSESDWPPNSSLPRATFVPNISHSPVTFKDLLPEICEFGEDLLKRMLVFDSGSRITAFRALKHPYFHGVEGYMNLFESSF